MCLLILSNNKENVTFAWRWDPKYLFMTITEGIFVIYIPIRGYAPDKWLVTPDKMA
jgi:hypothetical protein